MRNVPLQAALFFLFTAAPLAHVGCSGTSQSSEANDAGSEDANSQGDGALPIATSLPEGSVTPIGSDCSSIGNEPEAPSIGDSSCIRVEVNCEGLEPLQARVAISEPNAKVAYRGLVILSSGTGGGAFYATNKVTQGLVRELSELGFRVAQRAWSGAWMRSETGAEGFGARSCRYALLADYLNDNYGQGGPLCISGQSGGSLEVSYATTHWGLGEIVDLVVPTAGPIQKSADICYGQSWLDECNGWHAALQSAQPVATACSAQEWECHDPEGIGVYVDVSFPSASEPPCAAPNNDELVGLLSSDSATGDAQTVFASTSWRFLIGDGECGLLAAGAASLSAELSEAGTDSSLTLVEATRHGVPNTEQGKAAIKAAILDGCVQR